MIDQQAPAVIHAARRFASHRRRRRWAVLLAAGLLMTLAAGGYVLSTSQAVSVQQLQISLRLNPTSSLRKAEVAAVGDAFLGEALIRVSPAEVQRQVAALPAVKTVTVQRRWPHTLVITVVAREALVELQTPTSTLLADGAGVIFRSGGSPGLPVIRVNRAGLQVGAHPDRTAAMVVDSFESVPGPLRSSATDLMLTPGGLQFRIGRIQVVWGDRAAGAEKAAELRGLLRNRPARDFRIIDVSTVGVVATRARQPRSQTSPERPGTP